MGGVSGSKSWSNKEEAVERGGQSVIQAVLETNHAGNWGHSGIFSSFFFVVFSYESLGPVLPLLYKKSGIGFKQTDSKQTQKRIQAQGSKI